MQRLRSLPRRRRGAGFTLVEVLIAMGLLGLIAVGVLPLFTQAMRNNVQGSRALNASASGTGVLETAIEDRFGSTNLSWTTGATSLTVPTQYLVEDLGTATVTPPQWLTSVPGGTPIAWTRDGSVQQYTMRDFLTGTELGAPLPGNTEADFVHLKQIETRITPTGSAPFTVRVLKAY